MSSSDTLGVAPDKASFDDVGRERWSSRMAFVVAAIGSAIGIGNVWRFPALCFKYGGGAFFIPYLLSLFLLGIPLLILEVGLGQSFQGGDAVVFGKMNPRLRAIGLASVWASFMWVGYFCVMVAWFVRMFVYSCYPDLPWQTEEFKYSSAGAFAWAQKSVMESSWAKDAVPEKIAWANVLCFLFVWLSVWVSLFFGIKTTGRLTYVTMGLPVVVIVILVIRGVTLENASYGLLEYIGRWDLTLLTTDPAVWSVACTQIFVSIGVTYGVMTAYASYNATKENVNTNSWIVALCNSSFSILGGFAVFSSLGYMCCFQSKEFLDGWDSGSPLKYDSELPDTDNVAAYPYNGFGLSFWDKEDDCDGINCQRRFNKAEYQDWFSDIVSGCSSKNEDACRASSFCSVNDTKCIAYRCSSPDKIACEGISQCKWDGRCLRLDCRDVAKQDTCNQLPQCEFKTSCEALVIDKWMMHGVPLVPVENLRVEGPGLVLGAYPVVFATMPLPHLWSLLFFFIMYLLGINSAFSFVEGVVTVLLDTKAFHRQKRTTIVSFVSVIGFLISICYAHEAGYNAIKTTDNYICIVMLFIGIFETAASCWIYRWPDTVAVCGVWATRLLFLAIYFPALLAGVLCFAVGEVGIGVGLSVAAAAALVAGALYMLHARGNMEFTYQDRVAELFVGNIEYLRFRFNRGCLDDVESAKWYRRVPFAWSLLVKFFIPPVLIFLTFNLLCAEKFGSYDDLAVGYQVIGMVIAFTGVVVVVLGLAFPNLFTWLEHQSTNVEPEYMIDYYHERRCRMLTNASGFLDKSTETSEMDPKEVALTQVAFAS